MRKPILFPGQRVITTEGKTETVAFTRNGQAYVFGCNGLPKPVKVVGDAWGGEHDQEIGLAA